MRNFRFFALLGLIFVLAACGRRLPDDYFYTNTDLVAEAVAEDSNASADDDSDSGEMVEVDPVANDENRDEDTQDATENESVETAPEPQFELVEVPADPIITDVANANPVNGEALLNASVPCSSCHNFSSEDTLVGPGMLNLPMRAENRIQGEVAERYLYNSIVHPNDFVVDGFTQGIMPAVYVDAYTEQDLLDIVAYLMTLGDYPAREPVFMEVPIESGSENTDVASNTDTTDEIAEPSTETTASTEATDVVELAELDLSDVPVMIDFLVDNGSVIQGEALFNTALVDDRSCSSCHSPSDLSDIDTTQALSSYLWATIFSEQLHPNLGSQYEIEITGAQASHIVTYLISLNQVETDE